MKKLKNQNYHLDYYSNVLYNNVIMKGEKEMKIDNRINSLKKGSSIFISGNKLQWTTVERSGCGKILRFVRNTKDGFEVFKKCSF